MDRYHPAPDRMLLFSITFAMSHLGFSSYLCLVFCPHVVHKLEDSIYVELIELGISHFLRGAFFGAGYIITSVIDGFVVTGEHNAA